MSGRIRADRRVGLLLGGAVLFVFVSLAATVILPATDPALSEPSAERALDRYETSHIADRLAGELEGEPDESDVIAALREGMTVYRTEGCWYCHTQQVRPSDEGLGEPLAAGDYELQDPSLLGSVRVGPDLTHVGSRYGDATELTSLLRDPRAGGRHSSMPSYGYLSTEDMQALVDYLLALK